MSTESLAVCFYSAEGWEGDSPMLDGVDCRIPTCATVRRVSLEGHLQCNRNDALGIMQRVDSDQQDNGGFFWRSISALCSFLWNSVLNQTSVITRSLFGRGVQYIPVNTSGNLEATPTNCGQKCVTVPISKCKCIASRGAL